MLNKKNFYINGEWIKPNSSEEIAVVDPATEENCAVITLGNKIDIDIIKIASFDIGNLSFINRVSNLGKPIVLSIGGGKYEQIKSSIELLQKNKSEVAILHCVSEYPCEYNKLGLNNIKRLINSNSKK